MKLRIILISALCISFPALSSEPLTKREIVEQCHLALTYPPSREEFINCQSLAYNSQLDCLLTLQDKEGELRKGNTKMKPWQPNSKVAMANPRDFIIDNDRDQVAWKDSEGKIRISTLTGSLSANAGNCRTEKKFNLTEAATLAYNYMNMYYDEALWGNFKKACEASGVGVQEQGSLKKNKAGKGTGTGKK